MEARRFDDALRAHLQRQEELLTGVLGRDVDVLNLQRPLPTPELPAPIEASVCEDRSPPGTVEPAWLGTSEPGFGAVVPKPPSRKRTSMLRTGTSGQALDPNAAHLRTKSIRKFMQDDGVEDFTEPETLPLMKRVARKLTYYHELWVHIEEPKRTGCTRALVHGPVFAVVIPLAIFANTMYTTYQANYTLSTFGEKPENDLFVELGFTLFFCMEIGMKLFVHRLYFFVNEDMNWNILDAVVVASALLDQTFILFETTGASFGGVGFARALRIFRMAKVLRVFRALRYFKELRIMITSLTGSFVSLFWSLGMLMVILYVFALFFVQQMLVHIVEARKDPYADEELMAAQMHYFSSVQDAMRTLSMCTTGGKDWEEIWVLIAPLGPMYDAAFVFYLAFFTVAVMNILTGIFVEQALGLAKPSDVECFTECQVKLAKAHEELMCILERMDADGNGMITYPEFISAMDNERVIHALASIGIEIKNADLFFFALLEEANTSGAIDIADLVDRMVRMRGQASSVEVSGLAKRLNVLQRSIDALCRHGPPTPSRETPASPMGYPVSIG